MASFTSLCGICDLRHRSNPSTIWCPECEDSLCSDCNEHHSLSKGTRNHKTIPITDYHKLPAFISDIQHICSEHDRKYQMFCKKDDIPLCNKCIKAHLSCGDVVPLDEVISNIKSSEALEDLSQCLADLMSNVNKMKKNREDNIERLKDQKRKWVEDIKNFRGVLDEHLDKLEKQMISEIENIEKSMTIKIKEVVDDLDKKEKEIAECLSVIGNMRENASDLQAFLGARKIQSLVTNNAASLQSFFEDKKMDSINLKCEIVPQLKQLLPSVQLFGTVQIQSSPSICELTQKKDKHAQIILPVVRNTVDHDVILKLQQTYFNPCKTCRGCIVTDLGTLLLADHPNGSILSPNQGCLSIVAILTNSAFDLTPLDDVYTLVTSGDFSAEKGVVFLNMKTWKLDGFVDLPGNSYGITRSGKNVILCVENSDLHVISLDDYSITTIPNTRLPSYSYVTAFEDKIYYTNNESNLIACCHLDGTHEWKLETNDFNLREPRGIAVDNHGYVYVAGESTDNVVVISQDGRTQREILSAKNDIISPSAIFYDKPRDKLIVTSTRTNCSVHIYNVSLKK